MKVNFKFGLLIISLFIAFTFNVNAQKKGKSFRGIVTYELKYSGDELTPAQQAQLPKEQVVKIWDNKTLQEQKYGPVTITEITNGDEGSKTTLYDLSMVMAKKIYVKTTKSEIEEKLNEKKDNLPVIKYTEETKNIAGIKAQKAEVSFKDDETGDVSTVVVYFSDELGGEDLNYGDTFHGLKGFPLEFEINMGKIKVQANAKSVVKGKVKESEFLIPTDYQQITKEELQEMMGGGEEE
jgi:GLPGLI family protein